MGFIAAIFVLGFLVFVHELGHFLAAKRLGIKVHEFAIGFGPIIFTYLYGETAYRLRAIPLGGFVHMEGEDFEDEEAVVDGDHELENQPPKLRPEEDPENLMSKTVFQRFQVFFAGPLMNWITAFLIVAGVSFFGAPEEAWLHKEVRVGFVTPDSAAAELGLKSHDVITAINGEPVETWEALNGRLPDLSGDELSVTVERNGTTTQLTGTATGDEAAATLLSGALPYISLKIDSVIPGKPAAEAGLKEDDRIVSIAGEPADNWSYMVHIVSNNPGTPLEFTFLRDGQTQTVTVTPEGDEPGSGKIGVYRPVETVTMNYGLFESIWRGLRYTYNTSAMMVAMVGQLVTLQADSENLGGPLMIMQQAGEVASERGTADLLMFTAFISLNLFILNLMPFPILDGGHIMFLIPEIFTGRIVSQRIRLAAMQVGFLCLMSLMLYVTFNDLRRTAWFSNLLDLLS